MHTTRNDRNKARRRGYHKQPVYRCHRDRIPTPEEKFAEVLHALRGMLDVCEGQPLSYTCMVIAEHARVAQMMDGYARQIGAEQKYYRTLQDAIARGGYVFVP